MLHGCLPTAFLALPLDGHAEQVCGTLKKGDVVLLPKGMWSHHTRTGFTSNALIPETLADLAGQAAYNDARVEVTKV